MMMARGIVAFLVVVAGVTAYLLLQPVPDDVGDSPWTLRITSLESRIRYYGKFLVPTGLYNWLDQRARANSRAFGQVPYKDAVFDRVPVRIFADEPAAGKTGKRPAIVYYHGGGFISGSVDSYHPLTALLAKELPGVVVAVDYRLAPKYAFPGAIDECTAATVWFLQHLSDYDVDPARVALMGDSAGGNLAAATTQRLTFDPKYRGLPRIKMQVLIYPCLQAFDFNTPSFQQWGDHKTLMLDRDLMSTMWDLYLHGNKGSSQKAMLINNHTSSAAKRSPLIRKCLSHDLIPDEFKKTGYQALSTDFGDEGIYDEIKEVLLNPDYSPIMREDLRGLPEAYVLTAQYDVLRDDGIMYAKRLEKAGVKVTWKNYKKGYHCMFFVETHSFRSTRVGEQSVSDFIQFARKNI